MSEEKSAEMEWVERSLIPKVLSHLGKSGDNVRWKIEIPQNTFFLSSIFLLTVFFDSDARKKKETEGNGDTLNLVIKKPPETQTPLVEKMNMQKQYHNEILFYTKVGSLSSRFPRCIYAVEAEPDRTAIVLENISTLGYDVCADVTLPLDHVLAAVEEMARFHANGYAMKEKSPEYFDQVIKDIREPRFLQTNAWMNEFLDIVATRPIDWLRENNVEPEFCDKLEKHFGNAYKEVMLECIKPVEPLATLCHGDFTRNNVFFRKKNGKVEAMLFDFAYITYSSPAIDIATILYLNCSMADRAEKFDDIFRAYHTALIAHLRAEGVKVDERYSYDNFLADYKRRGSFGFMIAIFFLPIIRGLCTDDIEKYHENLTEGAQIMKKAGGAAMTDEFGQMVLELIRMGCFDHLKS